jgi:Zn-dependent protease
MEPTHLIQTVLIYALPVLFAITVHEAAHGYAARHFGDNTAWGLGRVTLNPLKHIPDAAAAVLRHQRSRFVWLRQARAGAL